MSEKFLPMETTINIDEIQSTLFKEILIMDDFPDDKKIEIAVEFMVVPKKMEIKISKK